MQIKASVPIPRKSRYQYQPVPFPSKRVGTNTIEEEISVPSSLEAVNELGIDTKTQAPEVDWHRVIWSKHHVPRRAIIQWMCYLGRMANWDRLHKWGMIDSDLGLATFLLKNGCNRPCLDLAAEFNWLRNQCGGVQLA
ncbi:hypothetical protein RHSIM_Rhsim03G0090200 [Rhododendron simsii]|uniref:Reverse transcriptase zinc-binding domain-containing protein n=1 Tax=Rhododendron simsii TaxID=118357 RepID=A0A834HCX4_RHOSS|nr:hypothetical protein RHSIM_Rhsim03G0090200 [Rhododendron simsii]